MKKLIVFMSSVVILGSCSSEKTLSEQIKYDWDVVTIHHKIMVMKDHIISIKI